MELLASTSKFIDFSSMKTRLMLLNVYSHSLGRGLLHFLFWTFIFLARVYIGHISISPFHVYPNGILLNSFLATINSALVYYLLVYLVYGKFITSRRYISAVLSLVACILLYTWIDLQSEYILLEHDQWKNIILNNNKVYYEYLQQDPSTILLKRILSLGIIFQLFVALALPLMIKIMISFYKEQVKRHALAKENVELEFQFLKSQVNPHFLFNTLNNVYSMILHDKKEQSADTIARLSAFLRYSLYDTSSGLVPVKREFKMIGDYIELEKIRLNHTRVTDHLETDGDDYQMPPLLLIPIIENAFKYCLDVPGSCIDIEIKIEKGKLCLICKNHFDPANNKGPGGGIGLNNVTRRLEQHYPGQYLFEIDMDKEMYTLTLIISQL